MSKFNQKRVPAHTYEGGIGYEKDPFDEWINFLFSSYAEDGFYESANEQVERYVNLTKQVGERYGWDFVARASFFARNYLGMRSISQITAAMLNDVSFQEKRNYFKNFFHRPDDVAEVFSIIENIGSNKRSHALVRGAADYLSSLSAYSLGKYQMKGKQYNLYDLINITHATSENINLYKINSLPVVDTWETAISTAAPKDKAEEWKRLVEQNKLGYLALIRNLRNIVQSNNDEEWIANYVCPQLENQEAIKKSLVFPYQIYQAYRMVSQNLILKNSLEKAFCVAAGNVPKLDGKSVILLDVSGSMNSFISQKSVVKLKEVGAVFAATLYLNNSDIQLIKFGDRAKSFGVYNIENNIFNVIDAMCQNDSCGYGTRIDTAYEIMQTKFDRIFIISDMQIMGDKAHYWWWSEQNGVESFERYCNIYNPDCKCYSFDLANYSTQLSSPDNPNVHLLTALNDKIFDLINLFEKDNKSIIEYINTHYDYCS